MQETPELTSHGYTKSTPIFRAVSPKEKLRADCTAPSQQGIKESHREWPERWSNHNDGNPNFDVENCTSRGNTHTKKYKLTCLEAQKSLRLKGNQTRNEEYTFTDPGASVKWWGNCWNSLWGPRIWQMALLMFSLHLYGSHSSRV